MTYPYIVNPAKTIPAVFHTQSGTLRATLSPEIYDRKIAGLAINGPAGTTFDLYQDNVSIPNRKDGTLRGQSNTADYPTPRSLPRGASLIAVWTKTGLVGTDIASVTFFQQLG